MLTAYDILMALWGLVYILAWVAFILVMHRLFQREEQEWEAREARPSERSFSQQQPLHHAA